MWVSGYLRTPYEDIRSPEVGVAGVSRHKFYNLSKFKFKTSSNLYTLRIHGSSSQIDYIPIYWEQTFEK